MPLIAIMFLAAFAGLADRAKLSHFENTVRPLLAAKCYDCHGAEKQKNGLRLDHISFIHKGGESGPALPLIPKAIRRKDPDFSMPPKQALTESEVAILTAWIEDGAYWPEETPKGGAVDADGFTAEERAWWAVQPVAEVTPPEPAIPDWGKNEIDRFVAKRLKDAGLEPALPASLEELVRRVYFDLHGLPPTPAEVAEFANAASKDSDAALASLVDKLLESPRYAERWAQHWLDVVRYADSDGYRADDFRPEAYRYRDYVINAIHTDKPYDEFVRDQLAADEFGKTDPKDLVATAFLRHGVYEWNQRDARMQWGIIMDEMTRVTGEVFLGIGIGCAQCHNHKFDPILQKDYVALQAFLSTTYWPVDRPFAKSEDIAKFAKEMAAWEEASKDVRAKIDAMVQTQYDNKTKYSVGQFPPDVQEIYNKPAAERTAYEAQLAEMVHRQVVTQNKRLNPETSLKKDEEKHKAYLALQKELEAIEVAKPKALPKAFLATDIARVAAPAKLHTRSGSTVIEPAFLKLLGQPAPAIEPTETSTGRRRALAKWISSADNPLSTRVITNRIWQRHFGKGIVATPNDFGKLGEAPTHPALLDFLTQRFVAEGWRMKPLHRYIMASATYQQTARREPSAEIANTDPGNSLLWRFPPQRLSAEQVRDAMLATSGGLKHRFGGSSRSGSSDVRSVYVKKMRNTPDPVLHSFDAPQGFDSAPNRTVTTTPVQSLLLANNDWPLKRADAFASKLLGKHKNPNEALVQEAYQTLYARAPSVNEVAGALAFIEAQSKVADAPASLPEDKYPDETGLRPVAQHFKGINEPKLGEKTLWIQPGSRFERLQLPELNLGSHFTVEAVAILDRLYPDGKVNTLVSRWNGSNSTPGWSIGVTSTKSAYQPRNFIVQLIGENSAGNTEYVVVASNLRVPQNKPVYLAVSINVSEGGSITFYMKDLSDPEATLQTAEVKHDIVADFHGGHSIVVGGRSGRGHQWDGQIARLSVANELAGPDQLVLGSRKLAGRQDWIFGEHPGEEPIVGANWLRTTKAAAAPRSKTALAVVDFCHALYNSNEFLYLH